MNNITINNYNLQLINWNQLFINNICDPLWNDLEIYSLLGKKLGNKDVKGMFYHHIIYNIINYMVNNNNSYKKVIHLCKTDLNLGGFDEYYNEEEFIKLVLQVINRMSKIFPIKVYVSEYSYNHVEKLIENEPADAKELIMEAKSLCDEFKIEQFSFRKVNTFTKRYGLKALSRQVFDDIRTKQLVLS